MVRFVDSPLASPPYMVVALQTRQLFEKNRMFFFWGGGYVS